MKLIRPLMLARLLLLLVPFVLTMGLPALAEPEAPHALRLNELRIKGSHNSYHRRPFIALHPRHRYDHDSLFVQLEYHGVRAFELDVHLGNDGYEVYHIRFIDGRSRCREFVECLRQIRSWSDLDRNHEPLMIWIEAKDFAGGKRMDSLRPVDEVIRRVVGDRLLSPDDVRGAHPSLRMALMADGWPTLSETRGKILFMLTASEEQRAEYTSGFRHLRGRAMFAEANAGQWGQSWAAVAKIHRSNEDLMGTARPLQLLVTTTTCTADVDDLTCATNKRWALENGANILLDDYVRPVPGRLYHLDLGEEVVTAIATSELPPTQPVGDEPGG